MGYHRERPGSLNLGLFVGVYEDLTLWSIADVMLTRMCNGSAATTTTAQFIKSTSANHFTALLQLDLPSFLNWRNESKIWQPFAHAWHSPCGFKRKNHRVSAHQMQELQEAYASRRETWWIRTKWASGNPGSSCWVERWYIFLFLFDVMLYVLCFMFHVSCCCRILPSA